MNTQNLSLDDIKNQQPPKLIYEFNPNLNYKITIDADGLNIDEKHSLQIIFREILTNQDKSLQDSWKNLLVHIKLKFHEKLIQEVLRSYTRIMLPIIRRVMPSIIAKDIIGVSPMIGPVTHLHKLPRRKFLQRLKGAFRAFMREWRY